MDSVTDPTPNGKTQPKNFQRSGDVDVFTAYTAMLAFIDNDLRGVHSLLEVKAKLIIWRKTHGWGKFSEEIGAAEMAKRAGANKNQMKVVLAGLPETIATQRSCTTSKGNSLRLRTRYSFPIEWPGKQATPGTQEQATPWPGKQATQSCTSQSCTDQSSSQVLEVAALEHDDEAPFSEKKNPNTEDRDSLIETAALQLQATRASSSMVPLDQVRKPDPTITTQILSCFGDYLDFTEWLKTTGTRGLARKAKTPTWGLYLQDAKNEAEDVGRARLKAEKEAADFRIAAERRQAEEADRERVEHTAITPEEAIALAGKVPDVIKRRLIRLAQPITPAEVIQMKRQHWICGECVGVGLIGSAIEKTRHFCDCLEGQELEHEDPNRPAMEIEHAHSGLQNKLVVAARETFPSGFLGDAIESATITETPTEIMFDVDGRPNQFVLEDKHDVPLVLKAIGEHRRIRFAWIEVRKSAPLPTHKPPITAADFAPLLAAREVRRAIA